jgi:small subunit ribosomal protein S1
MPMFLPASHFSLKRNPTEQSMFDVKGKTLTVHIHELQVDESKRKTVIVSRKKILEDKFWDSLKIGDVIEGPITSIAQFGVFVDVYGVEGLIHVTRLSNTRIEDLKTTYKKGQLMKAVIVDISKEKKRIGLSSRELEESPWKGLSDELKPGNLVKGVVRRITEFGAYVEVKPNVDGLVRTNEISWTLRIKHPNEVFTQNQEDEFYVVSVQEDKGILALSIKRKSENPWKQILEKYPAKTKVNGTIKFLEPQGAVININNEVDGFMPRSKMRFLPKGNGNPGDVVEVIIDNVDLEKESMIVIPIMDDKPQYKPKEKDSKPKGDYKPRHNKDASESNTHSDSNASNDSASFTLQDLISDSMKKNLLKV